MISDRLEAENVASFANVKTLDQVSLPVILAPVTLIAFNRPDTLKQVLESISKQTVLPPQIFAFIDFSSDEGHQQKRAECITLLEDFNVVIPTEIVLRSEHLGCKKNTLSAISQVLRDYPSTVLIEDDIFLSPVYYETMNKLLGLYASEKKVFCISPYLHHAFPESIRHQLESDIILHNQFLGWGVGLWADRWFPMIKTFEDSLGEKLKTWLSIPPYPLTSQTFYHFFIYLTKRDAELWDVYITTQCLRRQYGVVSPRLNLIKNLAVSDPNALHGISKDFKLKQYSYSRYYSEIEPKTLPTLLQVPSELMTPIGYRRRLSLFVSHFPSMMVFFLLWVAGERARTAILKWRKRLKRKR